MNETTKVRLDRWLWAARFFKTRSAAKAAIDGGKIHCAGTRAKPSKEIGVGVELVISRGTTEQTITVTGIAETRGRASDAMQLYRETDASVAARLAAAEQRRLVGGPVAAPPIRPDRRARRELLRMKQSSLDDDESYR
jgi:ribosome-associated heat shock protein Hsp15